MDAGRDEHPSHDCDAEREVVARIAKMSAEGLSAYAIAKALLEKSFGSEVANAVVLDGAPRDMESATALAHKRDDRSRKEFEKWAILTYTNNRGVINEKKGATGALTGLLTSSQVKITRRRCCSK